ncbi:hypothetical protein [Hymenobacter segetis]|uniref:Uncharacterized protein n=1 Tax=Hymenobacter segetis TaxID=2025509 RepID=A0ABU9LZJ4_9BACT
MLLYSIAEVRFRERIIRYIKARKGTSFQQLLDLRQSLQQANPALIVVALAGEHHFGGASTAVDDDLLTEYFQTREFVNERLVWTKEVYAG